MPILVEESKSNKEIDGEPLIKPKNQLLTAQQCRLQHGNYFHFFMGAGKPGERGRPSTTHHLHFQNKSL